VIPSPGTRKKDDGQGQGQVDYCHRPDNAQKPTTNLDQFNLSYYPSECSSWLSVLCVLHVAIHCEVIHEPGLEQIFILLPPNTSTVKDTIIQ